MNISYFSEKWMKEIQIPFFSRETWKIQNPQT